MRARVKRTLIPWSEVLDPRRLPSGIPVGSAPEVGSAPTQPYDDPSTEPLDRSTGVDVDLDLLGIPRDSGPALDVTIPATGSPAGDYPASDPGVIYT